MLSIITRNSSSRYHNTTNSYELALIYSSCFFISLCHNHVIMPVFSESLVNGNNKYSSHDLIRDFTVETASKSRHIQNSKWITKHTYRLINKKAIRSSGKIHFLRNAKASYQMQVKLCFDMKSVHCLWHHHFSLEKTDKDLSSYIWIQKIVKRTPVIFNVVYLTPTHYVWLSYKRAPYYKDP